MPKFKRHATAYPGVYWIESSRTYNGRPERVYYIRYRRKGRLVDEKAGRSVSDEMTAAIASQKRSRKISGEELPNTEQRLEDAGRGDLDTLWAAYKEASDHPTIETDRHRYRAHLGPAMGKRRPDELSRMDTDRLRVALSKTHSPATVRHILSLFTRIVRWGTDAGLCQPLSFRVRYPKVDNEKTEDLTPRQLDNLLLLLEKRAGEDSADLMLLALFTGMRRGEMLKLEWRDVDLASERAFLRNPKGGKSLHIPLNRDAMEVLNRRPKDGARVFSRWEKNDRAQPLVTACRELADEAGLPSDFRPLHGLRHVFASALASSGEVELHIIQRLLTHKDPKMTQRYAHLRDDALKKASDVIGKSVRRRKSN